MLFPSLHDTPLRRGLTAVALTLLSAPVLRTAIPVAIAQVPAERLGYPIVSESEADRLVCYMRTARGELIDLGVFCISNTPVAASPDEPVLGTGDVQVTLRWATIDDLDLAVTDPQGQTVSYMNRSVPSGGTLDVDANAGCTQPRTNPVENVFWPPNGGVPGDYVAKVNLFTRCRPERGPIPFRLRILVKGQVQDLEGSVDDNNETMSFPFSLQ